MTTAFTQIFTDEVLEQLFPGDRTDRFFDALFGDVSEGAYDIRLACKDSGPDELRFEFQLVQRPGKCLACNLTYGLPQVFTRHPVININGLVQEIDTFVNGHARCDSWRLGATREISRTLHVIPLFISLKK